MIDLLSESIDLERIDMLLKFATSQECTEEHREKLLIWSSELTGELISKIEKKEKAPVVFGAGAQLASNSRAN